MDVSKLSSEEVNREIARRRSEFVLNDDETGVYPSGDVGGVLWPIPNYLDWCRCGLLLEEMLTAASKVARGRAWEIALTARDGPYHVATSAVWATFGAYCPGDSPTDAIRRAWLQWDEWGYFDKAASKAAEV